MILLTLMHILGTEFITPVWFHLLGLPLHVLMWLRFNLFSITRIFNITSSRCCDLFSAGDNPRTFAGMYSYYHVLLETGVSQVIMMKYSILISVGQLFVECLGEDIYRIVVQSRRPGECDGGEIVSVLHDRHSAADAQTV